MYGKKIKDIYIYIPYSREILEIWQFGLKLSIKKYWKNLNLVVAPCSILHHHEHYRCVSVAVLLLEVLEQRSDFENIQ